MTEQANQPATTAPPADSAAAKAKPPPKAPSKTPSKRSPGRLPWWIAGVLLVVVVLGGIWISWPVWSPSLPDWIRGPIAPWMEAGRGGGLEAQVAAVQKKLAGVETDIAKLRGEIASHPAAAAPDKLADQLRALSQRADATDKAVAELRERAAHVAPLEIRVAALEKEIKSLAAQPPASGGTPAAPASGVDAEALARLQRQTITAVDGLQQRVLQLSAALAGAKNQLAGAEKRIAALEARSQAAGTVSRDSAFVLAVGQLREAVRSGKSFAAALAGLRAIAGDDRDAASAIAVLQPYAAGGVADLATLRTRFAVAAPRIAAAAPQPATGWIDRVLARLSSLISIRRTGPAAAAGKGPEAVVARAELALDTGDIAGAVKALEGLTGAARDAAAPWLAGARARLAADAAVATLESEAIGRIGNTASGASGG